ncbi:MAG: CocE/NonD family hydrolase [Acidobacteria bacterium]|nr:CocE/NonD family hydrolase [Acidobacteriota bacterium]
MRTPTSIVHVVVALAGVAAIAATLGCTPGSADPPASGAGQPSKFGTYKREPAYDGANRYSVYVPMPDGVRVSVDYFIPTSEGVEASEPLPTILHYTRYTRAFQVEDDEGATRILAQAERDPLLQHVLHRGYSVAVADARGTGASFGVHNGAFSIEETADSYHIVEWIAAQPWSDGNVGMQGRSYPGMTQYQAATQAPPALKAIFPEMAGPRAYDFVFRGGTYKNEFIDTWGAGTRAADLSTAAAPVDEDPGGALRDAAVEEHAANLWAQDLVGTETAAFRDWVYETETARADWNSIATIDDLEAIDASGIAIYHLVGWYDIYTSQQPMLYASLEAAPQKMVIGPWIHSGGYGGDVHKAEFLRWYDHWLKGIDTGVMDEPPVHYYVMEGNHTLPEDPAVDLSLDEERSEDPSTWIGTDVWPPEGLATRRFQLASDGALSDSAGDPGHDEYTVDYTSAMGSFSRWMNGHGSRRQDRAGTTFFDERSAENGKALTYTTEPMAEAMTITGYPVLRLSVTSTHDDGDFFVYLEEIDADGRSHYVTEGALRASYRAVAEAPWNDFGLPFHRGNQEDVEPLPDGPAELLIDLMGTAITIDEGHRLRLTIAGADAANHALYPDPEGGDAPTVTIHRGGDDGSWLDMPVDSDG